MAGAGTPEHEPGSAERAGAVRVASSWRRRRPHSPTRRDRQVNVCFNEAELAQVAAGAAATGMAVGAFVAARAMEPLRPPTGAERTRAELLIELMGVHRQLRGVAHNLNQATAAFHAAGENADQLAAWARFSRQVAVKVDALVGQVAAARIGMGLGR